MLQRPVIRPGLRGTTVLFQRLVKFSLFVQAIGTGRRRQRHEPQQDQADTNPGSYPRSAHCGRRRPPQTLVAVPASVR